MAKTKKMSEQLAVLAVAMVILGGSLIYYRHKKNMVSHDDKACADGCNLGKEQFNLPQLYIDEIAIMNTIAETLEKAAESGDFSSCERQAVADIKVWKDMQRVKAMFTKEENNAAHNPVSDQAKPAIERLHKAQSKVQFSKGGPPLMKKIKAILDGA